MNPDFKQIFSRIFHRQKDNSNFQSNLEELFPKVGFLSLEKKNELENILGVRIQNEAFFEQALTHRSYHVVQEKKVLSNERMEFLGDAVLELIITEYLFSVHKNKYEGELSKIRSWLVNRKSMIIAGKILKIDEFLILSYGAEKAMINGSDSLIGDAMEAIIAAVYLDSGYEIARKFVLSKVLPIISEMGMLNDTNYKSILLEEVQAEGYKAPVYDLIHEEGPDHSKTFIVAVCVDDKNIAEGSGKSKKEAEQMAAKRALETKAFLFNQSEN